jgi:hypothetical protein
MSGRSLHPTLAQPAPLAWLWDRLQQREHRLAWYGALLLVCIVPMALAWGLDERTLRGANVWIKPIKFALSIALLAWTTAWFVGHLPAARRASPAVTRIVWLLIASGSFEFLYITLQAGLGEASHYNVGDLWHGLMYMLMGLGALLLTATQPLLAWQLWRHPDPLQAPAARLAMLLGLVLTFVLGAGMGILLGERQPPEGGLPLLGWVLAGGDLRPAHFLGIHAGQLLPLAGWLLGRRRWLLAFTALYGLAFLALLIRGLG